MPPICSMSSPWRRGSSRSAKSTSEAHLSEMISTAKRDGQSARKADPPAFCMTPKVPGGNPALRSFGRRSNNQHQKETPMPKVAIFDEFGGPEVLHLVEEPVTEPAAGEVRVKIQAAAVNPLDQM